MNEHNKEDKSDILDPYSSNLQQNIVTFDVIHLV